PYNWRSVHMYGSRGTKPLESSSYGSNDPCDELGIPKILPKRTRKRKSLKMARRDSRRQNHQLAQIPSRALSAGSLLLLFLFCVACRRNPPTVAVIPRTCGTALWEPEHAGAAAVARSIGINLYWNAPMRDNDVQTQISLIEKSLDRGVAGIIVSPIATLPMRTPMRRVLARGVPAVVV